MDEFLLTTSQSNSQGSIILYNPATKDIQRCYRNGGTISNKTVTVVGNEYILAAECNKPLLRLWPVNSQEPDKNIRLILPDPANCLDISHSSIYLAVGIGSKLYVWQLSSGKLLSIQRKHYQTITNVKFSSDSDFVATAGKDGQLIVYNLRDLVVLNDSLLEQREVGQVEPLYVKNDSSVSIEDMYIGNFGRKSRIATVSSDHSVRMYDIYSGDKLIEFVLRESLTAVVLDSLCLNLFVGGHSGMVRQFNLREPPRTLVHHVEDDTSSLFVHHKRKIVSMAIDQKNVLLATGSEDCLVCTWDISSKMILHKFEQKGGITNVRFVLAHENYSKESFKTQIVLKNLERNLYQTGDEFKCGIIQHYDIVLSDDEDSEAKKQTREQLAQENVKLRAVNHQLYLAALEMCAQKK